MTTDQLWVGLLSFVVFLGSTTFHEAAHAWAAWKLGDSTAHSSGQNTLNPVPHIRREPIGMIVVPILSFLVAGWMVGWASSPFDPNWARAYPKRAALMAFAGPAANFILLVASAMLLRAGIQSGVFHLPSHYDWVHIADGGSSAGSQFVAQFISAAFSLNLLLCVFNLMPFPPLDGSNLPLLFLNRSAANTYFHWIHQPAFTWLGLLVAWRLFSIIYPKMFREALGVLYSGMGPF